jgi:hypothetical protein
MNRRLFLTAAVTLAAVTRIPAADPPGQTCYELRVYSAAEGKLDALHSRFRDHTCSLFTKHGMTNVGYWVPLENPDRKLYYIVSYPSREAREASWKAFLADEDWKKAAAESEKNGKLVSKIESTFLHTTDFSPAVKGEKHGPTTVYELRTYTTGPGNLPKLLERFKKFTVELFTKHGMKHFGYWTLDEGQTDADKTLVYLLIHDSKAACEKSFDTFRKDPAWIAAKDASEKAAGGSLTVKDGVKSILMSPTDYSTAK